MKKIDNTPILDMKTDWGDPDGTGEKAKSLEQVQKFIKKKILELEVRMLSITHSELVALRNNSQLIPGMKYRITDYTIRDDFEGTIDNISSDVKYGSQGLVFDIVVTASSNNSLYEEAQAVEHEYLKGETHNPIELDYSKWKLKYTIDNDNPKYSWSDPLGKGVIYEMEDEYGNVCPYDFKNILFETDDDVFLTFDGLTLNGNYHHNIIKPWIVNGIQHLNAIILTADQCFNNVFEANCRDIKQLNGGDYFANNIFQNTCHTATIGKKVKNTVISANCSNWSIGHNCYTLNIGNNNDRWIVGDNCHNITTGSLNSDWTVGKYCMYITTGNHTWQWTCEDYTSSWTAGDSCIGFTIGSGYTREDEEYYIFENENINVTIETGAEYFLCRGLTNGVVPSSIKGAVEYLIELSSLYNHTLYVKKGGETPELIEISYSAFINKKRNNILIPGKQYLISDYHTFYYKDQYPNMCEVNKNIPIIVTADSTNTISPYARLADGSAEIRVVLYDDYKFPKRDAQYLYEGTKCIIEESSNVVSYDDSEYIELYLKDLDIDNKYYYTYVLKTDWDEVIAKSAYAQDRYSIQAYIVNINGLGQKGLQFDPTDDTHTLVAFTAAHSYFPEIPESRGMGEITWMKDDAFNEAPFDFKSIEWYFTEEEINNFDNQVYENGEPITGLAQYFTPNTPIPTFIGISFFNVITPMCWSPIIIRNSRFNKIFTESNNSSVTFVSNTHYSELHSQSTTNIYPFLNQKNCYSRIDRGVLYKTPYSPVSELGDSDSLTVSQKTITENFNSLNEKIDLNCAILPFSKVETSNPTIDSANKPSNPSSVILIPSKRCLAAFDGSKYYSTWDAFTINNVYYPSNEEYSHNTLLLRDINKAGGLFGSGFLIFNKSMPILGTAITTDFTEKLFITLYNPGFTLFTGYNYYGNLNTNQYSIIINNIQTKIQTPIKTSRVILAPGNYGVSFNIASVSGLTVVWENGEAPIIDSSKYNIFDFTEIFLNANKAIILITHKSCVSENTEVEESNSDYVDLGLPSGTLWATKNIGAKSPEEYGNYYAWGETEAKEEYTQENSLTFGLTSSELQTQGIIDDNNNLTSQFDAATVNLGSDWRMPTVAEMLELRNNCIIEFIILNGINGTRFTGPNGNSIFLPAAGIYFSSGLDKRDKEGVYLSSELSSNTSDSARTLYFVFNNSIITGQQAVSEGIPIRPVRNIETNN